MLQVTGFDPVAQRFIYRVNQSFGQPFGAGVASHAFAPLQVRIGAGYSFGGRDQKGYVHSMGVRPGVTSVGNDSAFRATLASKAGNPVDTILALGDSLALTPTQVARLTTVQQHFTARRDSAVAIAAHDIEARGKQLLDIDLYREMATFLPAMQQARSDARDAALALLQPDQKAKLAALLRTPLR